MKARSWRWLRSRIIRLLEIPPTVLPDGRSMHVTRLGNALYPPTDPKTRG